MPPHRRRPHTARPSGVRAGRRATAAHRRPRGAEASVRCTPCRQTVRALCRVLAKARAACGRRRCGGIRMARNASDTCFCVRARAHVRARIHVRAGHARTHARRALAAPASRSAPSSRHAPGGARVAHAASRSRARICSTCAFPSAPHPALAQPASNEHHSDTYVRIASHRIAHPRRGRHGYEHALECEKGMPRMGMRVRGGGAVCACARAPVASGESGACNADWNMSTRRDGTELGTLTRAVLWQCSWQPGKARQWVRT